MNNLYLEEYITVFERVLAVAYECGYSTASLEKSIAYSDYFQGIELDHQGFAPLIHDEVLVKEIFPSFNGDLLEIPTYNQCLWAAESYLRIQGATRLTFEAIFLYLPIRKMYEYFPLYHEMDFSKIIQEFERLYDEKSVLGLLIDRYHYSLTKIAEQIGVSYSVLSSLKQRKRDISKTSVDTVVKLSRILHVRVETIAETRI